MQALFYPEFFMPQIDFVPLAIFFKALIAFAGSLPICTELLSEERFNLFLELCFFFLLCLSFFFFDLSYLLDFRSVFCRYSLLSLFSQNLHDESCCEK